jgi:serine/threonine protein kinase
MLKFQERDFWVLLREIEHGNMNILMDGQGVAKLADFGSAATFPDNGSDMFTDSAGTT